MKKILITGALGHIGSGFIHGINKGEYDEVRLLDNLSTQRYCSLFNLPQDVKFKFIEDDICTADLEGYFNGVDTVIHLAAITDAASSFNIKDKIHEVIYEGTRRVAEACLSRGCKLLFLSTTSVYGTQALTIGEDCPDEELCPQSPYAESKLKAERLLEKMGKDKGLRHIICRFGTIFGTSPGMRFHTAINKFVWQACIGKPITVWRTAMEQKRPYLDLKDAVAAIAFIMKNNFFDKELYNVLTLNAAVSEIIDIIRSSVPDTVIEYVDSKIMNQLSYEVSCEKFKSLGFSFRGDIERGIKETIDLLRQVRHI